MNAKVAWPVLFLVALALTRAPGLLPENFSAVYALVFCAGVYLPRRMAWWLPLALLFGTDLLLNLHYQFDANIQAFTPLALAYLAGNYAAYLAIISLARRFRPDSSWLALLGGGLLGAVLFYLITNTAAWLLNPFHNPEYTQDLRGWIHALTLGTAGWPHTWEFFRNTLTSGGLFTGLFVGAMKLTQAREARKQDEPIEAERPDSDPEPAAAEESKA